MARLGRVSLGRNAMFSNRVGAIYVALIATLTSTACGPMLQGEYSPKEGASVSLAPTAARALVNERLLHNPGDGGKPLFLGKRNSGGGLVTSVKVLNGRLYITNDKMMQVAIPLNQVRTFVYFSPPKIYPARSLENLRQATVWLTNDWYLSIHPFTSEDWTRGLVDALQVLKNNASAEMVDDPAFVDAALRARSAAGQQVSFAEDMRRLQIQAESALRSKDFMKAVDLYGRALQLAPWWPEGRFNRAIVLGELGDYEIAILEMKRYLRLVPNAPDARTWQDKIYVWEGEASKDR
jgi:hypothetical protein